LVRAKQLSAGCQCSPSLDSNITTTAILTMASTNNRLPGIPDNPATMDNANKPSDGVDGEVPAATVTNPVLLGAPDTTAELSEAIPATTAHPPTNPGEHKPLSPTFLSFQMQF